MLIPRKRIITSVVLAGSLWWGSAAWPSEALPSPAEEMRAAETPAAVEQAPSLPVQAELSFPPPNAAGIALRVREEREVAPGVLYRVVDGINREGQPLVVHVLEADLTNPLVEPRPVVAAGGVGSRESLAGMAGRYGAVAAINGGFFSSANGLSLPVGNLMVDGQVLASSPIRRPSVGITSGKELLFGYFDAALEVELPAEDLAWPVGRVNRPLGGKQPVLYTPEWGTNTGTPAGTVELLAEAGEDGQGRVAGISREGNSPIPPGGFVLVFPDAADLPENVKTGEWVRVKQTYHRLWEGVEHLLTGGPLLVEEGRPVLQAEAEGFTGTTLGRNPRTAVGRTPEARVLMVVVDGRQPGYSAGVTLEELAYLVADLGAQEAVGLDGGGSSQMLIGGEVANRPSETSLRTVNTGFVILSQIPVYLDGRRLFFDVPPRLIEGRTLVPVRAIFESLGAEVTWQEETRQVRATAGGREVRLTVDDPRAEVDGVATTLDVPATWIDGRVLVPLRFVGEALGARVTWRSDPPMVEIESPRGREVGVTGLRPAVRVEDIHLYARGDAAEAEEAVYSPLPDPRHQRVVAEWLESSTTAHPNFLSPLPGGGILAVRNGHTGPSVVELDRQGQVVWSYGPVQANSTQRLPNGNTLITESGAPGEPLIPRVVEVNPQGEVVWSYWPGTRADAPRYAERLPGGDTLITTPTRVLQVNQRRQVFWEYGEGFLNAVQATRLSNGNILVVDQGIRGGARVLEVDAAGQVVWRYGDGTYGGEINQLRRPTAAVRMENGNTVIADVGSGRLLEVDLRGKLVRVTGFDEVLSALPVMNRWYARPLADGGVILSLSFTSGRSTILQVDGRSVRTYLDGEWLFTESLPVTEGEEVLVPAREFAHALGAEVHWDSTTRTLTLVGTSTVVAVLGEVEAYLDGQPLQLAVAPRLSGGQALVPLAMLTAATGVEAAWDPATLTITIKRHT